MRPASHIGRRRSEPVACSTATPLYAWLQLFHWRLRRDSEELLPALQALLRCVVASRLPESGWYTAAEAAIAAIYALHPSPQARLLHQRV